MGVLNVTPDSFSDGGRHFALQSAVARAREMAAEGAAIIDVGGESTRPGAAPVDEVEELRRVIPVVEAVAADGLTVSVDTMKPAVMRAAAAAGAEMLNDVNALRSPGALEAACESGCAVVLMHMQGEPRTMQAAPVYADVVAEVREFLLGRARACVAGGIARDRLVLDPGFGFGKTLDHNLALLAAVDDLADAGLPVLVGLSRKSMFAGLLGRAVDDRLAGSLAAATLAAWQGARLVRTHDVRSTMDALRVTGAALAARN